MEGHLLKQPNSSMTQNMRSDDLTSTILSLPSSCDHDEVVSFFDNFPPGYRFVPTDEELIGYLQKKITNQSMPKNRIRDVDLYRWNPWDLEEKYKRHRSDKKEWYYFTPRDRKYKHGQRPDRAAKGGYYKAIGKEAEIHIRGQLVGFKRALVFYKGKAQNGDKTEWIMHEYRLYSPEGRERKAEDDMRLDDWVLCKLYKTLHHRSRNQKESGNGVEDIQPVEEYQNCNQVESNHQMEEILSLVPEIPQGSNTHYETESYVHNDYASAPYDNAYASNSVFSSEQQPIQPSSSDIYSSTGNLGNYGEVSFYTVDATPINQCQAYSFTPSHLMSNGGPRTVLYTSNPSNYIEPAIQEPIQPSRNAFDIHNLGLDTHGSNPSNYIEPAIQEPIQPSLNAFDIHNLGLDTHGSNPSNYIGPAIQEHIQPSRNAFDIHNLGLDTHGSNPSNYIEPAIQEPIQPSLNAFDIHNLGLYTHSGFSSNMFGATPTDPYQSSSGYNEGSPQDEELELLLSKLVDHIQGVNTQQPITRLSAVFNPGPRLGATTNQVPHIGNSKT